LNELPAKATVFNDRPLGTERVKQINVRRGINYLPAETSAPRHLSQTCMKENSRTQNSNRASRSKGRSSKLWYG